MESLVCDKVLVQYAKCGIKLIRLTD